MLVKTFAAAVFGIEAVTVTIEVDVTRGVRYLLVGLPDAAVKESQQRIESAFRAAGLKWPGRQIVINMAPADIRKEGSSYDLPLAVGIMTAAELADGSRMEGMMVTGELSLDGGIKPVRGVLPMALQARAGGFRAIMVPAENAAEAAVVGGLDVYGVSRLEDVLRFMRGEKALTPLKIDIKALFDSEAGRYDADFAEVKGQESVKRALEVAASGSHNLLMIGPPGAGKTMLARRLPGIIPPLTLDEALETTKIHSVAGKTDERTALMTRRPFRSPHHTISDIALVGGGNVPQPGEISLAHNGVLFLDELPEFRRNVLEVLRQPLEDRVITISRARFTVDYPASFMLIASMNPCPCGFHNHPEKECTCQGGMIQRYLNRISGPLLDRIDMHVEVVPVNYEKLAGSGAIFGNGGGAGIRKGSIPVSAPGAGAGHPETSAQIRERVVRARAIQTTRYANDSGIYCNAQMTPSMIRRYCHLDETGGRLMKAAMDMRGLSARAYDRILKVARTIADLDSSEDIHPDHLSEAINYRSLDREGWAG